MNELTAEKATQLAADLGDFRTTNDAAIAAVIRRAIAMAEAVAAEKTPVPRSGFVVSLNGLLRKASRACCQLGGGEGFALDQLQEHLFELFTRRSEGTRVLEEFFAVYVIKEPPAKS